MEYDPAVRPHTPPETFRPGIRKYRISELLTGNYPLGLACGEELALDCQKHPSPEEDGSASVPPPYLTSSLRNSDRPRSQSIALPGYHSGHVSTPKDLPLRRVVVGILLVTPSLSPCPQLSMKATIPRFALGLPIRRLDVTPHLRSYLRRPDSQQSSRSHASQITEAESRISTSEDISHDRTSSVPLLV